MKRRLPLGARLFLAGIGLAGALTARVAPAALVAPAASAGEGDARARRAAARCRKSVKPDSPGAVVAVVLSGAVVFESAFGLADVGSATPMNVDAVFDLASCSKQFTACTVLRLAERKKLALDDDARKHLPELREPGRTRPILVSDLLHMTEGLADYQNLVESLDGLTNEKVLGLVAKAERTFATGAKYQYSNTAYVLLGTIAARVSGKSFGDLVRTELLGPTGMKRSDVLDRKDLAIPGRVFGYALAEGSWKPDVQDTPGILGDGGVFSCAADLVLWEKALRAGKILSKESFAYAVTSGKLDSGEETGYGCGWELETRGGHPMAYHSGGWNGTSTYVSRALDRDLAVIVLRNQSDWDASKLGEALERIYMEGD